ncbi:MAG: thiamine-phosphate kinase [Acidobacteria bacterium]|nr:thiamine-phosphate kinase [Acidobacteriota bacterium]
MGPVVRSSATVADLGEHAVVQRIRERVRPRAPGVVTGIGDDAAVIEPDRGALAVVTTDTLVEGVHFDRTHSSPGDVGDKALAVNLSDLAAMGAVPRHVLLALSQPPACLAADVHRTTLVGGDVTASPGPLVLGVTAIGSARRRRVLGRDGARPGDVVYVSGTIGAAAAGLASFRVASEAGLVPEACRRRHRRPEARVVLGVALGRNRAARACIDLSDGLGDAVHRIAAASGVGVRLDAEALPIHPEARTWFEAAGLDPLAAALAGGEDFELAFTSPSAFRGRLRHVRRQIGELPLTPIGVVTKAREVCLRRDGRDEPLPGGYEHFASLD